MLSIVIPAKNEEKYLPKLLNSLGRQGIDLEIIVADANSTDRTREIAESYCCRVVRGGLPAEARNNGAKCARGNVLVFIDSDVILPENFLSSSSKEFEKRKLDVAGTLQKPIPTKNCFKDFKYDFYYKIANLFMGAMQRTSNPYMQVCMFARKEIHEKIKGFDETLRFAEDSEYAKRAVKLGARFGILSSGGKNHLSARRFEKEGSLIALKYLYYNAARFFGKEFGEKSGIKYHDDLY